MGIRTSFRRWLMADGGSDAPAAVAPGSGQLQDHGSFTVTSLMGGSGGSGLPMTESRVMSLPGVLRALEVLTGLFAMTPMVYYRRTSTGKVRAENSPLYAIFHDRPNQTQSAFLFKEVLLGDMLLSGAFGAYVHRDDAYRPAALSRLAPPIGVLQSWDERDGAELFYDVRLPNGRQRRLSRTDCWHVPGFSRDGLVGLRRLQLLADTFDSAISANEFATRFWENNAQPTTVLTTKGRIEKPAKESIKSDWQALFGGSRRAGGVAVLDQELTPSFHAHDNKASQHIETRQFGVVEVARAFGVPPHVLFELSRATFSNIEQQSLELILFSMMAHYERVAGAATHFFAEPGHFFEFMPDALLKGDLKSRYEAYKMGIEAGILSPNEARRKDNMNDREGGDEYRVGSGSQIEGQQPAPAPDAPPAPPAPPEEEDE